MFNVDRLIPVEDLDNPEAMSRHRGDLDREAKQQQRGARLMTEEVHLWIPQTIRDGQIVTGPQTDHTRAFRVLKRFYR